jgi:hypothetical protein
MNLPRRTVWARVRQISQLVREAVDRDLLHRLREYVLDGGDGPLHRNGSLMHGLLDGGGGLLHRPLDRGGDPLDRLLHGGSDVLHGVLHRGGGLLDRLLDGGNGVLHGLLDGGGGLLERVLDGGGDLLHDPLHRGRCVREGVAKRAHEPGEARNPTRLQRLQLRSEGGALAGPTAAEEVPPHGWAPEWRRKRATPRHALRYQLSMKPL